MIAVIHPRVVGTNSVKQTIFFARRAIHMEVHVIFVFCVVLLLIPGISCQNCSPGSFGESCTGDCHCNPPECSSVDGRCNSGTCADGWTDPPLCQTPCSSGTFGAGCTGTCHCNPPGCSNINGRCFGASATCADGWTGFPFCQTPVTKQTAKTDTTLATTTVEPLFALCSLGSFGPGCNRPCHCKPIGCSSVDGRCNSGTCADGWTGSPLCQTSCSSGTFGAGCTGTCHCDPPGCSNVNGRCNDVSAACADGWTGFPFCQIAVTGTTKQIPKTDTSATRTATSVSSRTTKRTAKPDATQATTTVKSDISGASQITQPCTGCDVAVGLAITFGVVSLVSVVLLVISVVLWRKYLLMYRREMKTKAGNYEIPDGLQGTDRFYEQLKR